MAPGGPAAGRKRILALVTDAYGGHGGIAAYNRDVLDALADAPEIDAVHVLPRVISFPPGKVPERIVFDPSGLGGGVRYVRGLAKLLRRGGFDLVYCAHVNLAPLAWLAAKRHGCPWILAIYGIEAWEPSPRRSVRFAARRPDRLISISQVTLDKFLSFSRLTRTSRAIVPNAVHLSDFGVGPRNPALAQRLGVAGRRVVMTFGRISRHERYKGFDEIISLMPRLIRQVPDLVYLIAGTGDDQPRLEGRARELGLEDHVRFTGFIAEAEKPDLYRLADVFALPSRGEGFGFVLLEAMACGIPVIASRLDGGREAVLGGKLGRLVDPADEDGLAAAILAALDEPKRLPPGLSHFDFPHFAERLRQAVVPLAQGRDRS